MDKTKQPYFIIAFIALVLFAVSYQITMKAGDAISRKIFIQ